MIKTLRDALALLMGGDDQETLQEVLHDMSQDPETTQEEMDAYSHAIAVLAATNFPLAELGETISLPDGGGRVKVTGVAVFDGDASISYQVRKSNGEKVWVAIDSPQGTS